MRLSTLLFLSAPILLAADAVSPGRFVVERPTLICVGFEWQIAGDDNRNAIVEVSYRKGGENSWKQGMPLFWFGGEKVFRKDLGVDYTAAEMFAGSILGPGVGHRVRSALSNARSGRRARRGGTHSQLRTR